MPILGTVASSYEVPKSVVTGGTLTSDATYYYRTFTGNGTLIVSASALTCDVLIGAGGGSGGGNATGPPKYNPMSGPPFSNPRDSPPRGSTNINSSDDIDALIDSISN